MGNNVFLKISGMLALVVFVVGFFLVLERTPPGNFPVSSLPAAEKIASSVLGSNALKGYDKTSGFSFDGRDRKIVYITELALPTADPSERAEAFRGRIMSLPGLLPDLVQSVDIGAKPNCETEDTCKAKGTVELKNGETLKVVAFTDPETGQGTARISVLN